MDNYTEDLKTPDIEPLTEDVSLDNLVPADEPNFGTAKPTRSTIIADLRTHDKN